MQMKLFLWPLIFVLSIAGGSEQDEKRFSCDGRKSIEISEFCNGVKDCPEGEDETQEVKSVSNDEWQSCVNSKNAYNGSCSVRRELICSEDVVCANVDPCDLHCDDTHFRCQGSNKCVHRDAICNENPCDGCPESADWKNGVGFKCLRQGNECVLPQQLVLDDILDCDGQTDRCFVDKPNREGRIFLQDKCFRCLNDGMIIPNQRICDGVIDCPDLSDECLCEGKKPKICDQVIQYDVPVSSYEHFVSINVSGESHANGSEPTESQIDCDVGAVLCTDHCIPRSYVCDGINHCDIDERFDYCRGTLSCKDATQYEKVCRCQTSFGVCKTKYGTACDGVSDCDNEEDECEASCPMQGEASSCSMKIIMMSTFQIHHCRSLPLPFEVNRTSTGTLLSKIFEPTTEAYRVCNGVQDCAYGDDEDNCPGRLKCDALQPGYVSVAVEKTCDGFEDCKGGEDEQEGLCNSTRFRCQALGNRVSIDRSLVCDGIINCQDMKDELNCTEDGRFYCEGGEPLFVTERQKFDGRGDCLDWTDECPIAHPVETDGFSSRYEMIANPVLRTIVWIIALQSICGNAIVIFSVSKRLQSLKMPSPVIVANKLLILNLAASDILMGIYLAGLAISGVVMQGRYCSFDLKWRSSSSCLALGILAVLSSEASVMTMIMLTGCRLYAVFRPFKSSSNPRKRVVALLILLVWGTAWLIALIPQARSVSATFVTHAEFRNNPFVRNLPTSLEEARRLFSGLMTYDLKPNVTIPGGFSADSLSLHDIEKWGAELFVHEHFTIARIFGYYSTDSVCLPKFFATKSDQAWRFSFLVNLFNFLAFIFVAMSYAAIYIHTRRKSELASSNIRKRPLGRKASSDLQAKILRLIVTDFCCWIPICLMSFIQLGGIYLSNTAYVFAAIVLLPINSALNPILYSDLLDILYSKFRKLIPSNRKGTLSSSTTLRSSRRGQTTHTSSL